MNNYIRLGVISEVSGTKARVKIGNNIVTDFLPVLQIANPYKKSWTPVRVKEQCVVLPILGEINAGVILRGIYYTEFDAPSTDENSEKTEYKDGTKISYSVTDKQLNVSLAGGATINIEGSANITVKGSATVEAQSITAEASSAELICPNTIIKGNVAVNGVVTATGVIGTTITVGGAGGSELKSEGGKFKIDRPLEVTGDVKSSGLLYDKFGAIRTQNFNGGGN